MTISLVQCGQPVLRLRVGPSYLLVTWAFAALAASSIASGVNISAESNSRFVKVDSGRGLAIALANQLISGIELSTSITLSDGDWSNLGELPIILERNVTISGNPEFVDKGDLPVLNGSFVTSKLKLPGGTILSLTGIVLTWYRQDIPSSTPGMDLLTKSDYSPNTTGLRPPLMVLHKVALNNRLCFPESWSRQSVNATKRPDAILGEQKVTFDLPQPGCRNESTGPWLTRCYQARRKYIDLAAFGANYGPSGAFERTGYLVHAVETDLLCSGVMTMDCINKFGTVGCYYHIFPKNKAPPVSSNEQQNATVLLSSGAGGGGGGDDPSSSSRRTVLISVLGSTLGAATVIIAAASIALLVVRGRRLRRLQGNQTAAPTDPRTVQGKSRNNKQRDRGPDVDKPGGGSSGGGGEAQQPICLHAVAPPAAAADPFLRLGGPVGRGMLPQVAISRSNDGKDAEDPEGSMASRRGMAIAKANGESCRNVLQQQQQQQQHPDIEVPVTLNTPPRPDMQLMADPFQQQADDEVKLLPNATRGSGSYGRVVEGTYRGQRVAVKLVVDAYQWGGPSESLLRSFAQEVEVLCRCTHPNIVRLLAACLTPPRVCLVMELMETSLERLMYPHGRRRAGHQHLLPLTTVLHVSLEISKGLEYLHPTIIHRDLKPGNVLINDPHNARPVVKLTDFGLARLRITEVPTQTPDAGTPAYLAPEGLDPINYIITHKADMYSLAVMMWELLAGERPWRDCTVMEMAVKVILQGERPPLEALGVTRCPPKLRSLIVHCWDADPQRRPAAAEVAKSLALILQEVESEAGRGAAAAAPAGVYRNTLGHDGVHAASAAAAAGAADTPPVDGDPAGCKGGPGAQQGIPKNNIAAGLGGPDDGPGGPGGRRARVLAQQANTADMAAIAEEAKRVALETLEPSAAANGIGGVAEPPSAAPGVGFAFRRPYNQPEPPPKPAGAPGHTPTPAGPMIVVIKTLFGKKSADKRGTKAAAGVETSGPAGGRGGSAQPRPVGLHQRLSETLRFVGSSPFASQGSTYPDGVRACTLEFLGTSTLEASTAAASHETAAGAGRNVRVALHLAEDEAPAAATAVPRVPSALAYAPSGTC